MASRKPAAKAGRAALIAKRNGVTPSTAIVQRTRVPVPAGLSRHSSAIARAPGTLVTSTR